MPNKILNSISFYYGRNLSITLMVFKDLTKNMHMLGNLFPYDYIFEKFKKESSAYEQFDKIVF